ncbi:hypothetical protein [Tabrizicola soli]|uniref:Uncharacterized protein n=1 Tax=Tabrizicola soli TaxID=2185115 RepID=A0ABV7DZD7_9RHOB|nr:hypothetical protein [Tabrizicola soli]
MATATFEDDITYATCPVFDREHVAAFNDATLPLEYEIWEGCQGDEQFDWEVGINLRLIRAEIVRRAQAEPANGALRAFAEAKGIEVAA